MHKSDVKVTFFFQKTKAGNNQHKLTVKTASLTYHSFSMSAPWILKNEIIIAPSQTSEKFQIRRIQNTTLANKIYCDISKT